MTFSDLNLIQPLIEALKITGYENPTPIQQKAIPHLLVGRDVFGCAQTGTGKTAAFALPILQMLSANKSTTQTNGIKALILAPTRELAIQIGESFDAYGKLLSIRHSVIFGGVSQLNQTKALGRGVEVVIATPGRLLDLMQQGFVKLHHINFFVLDEVDRMLDMGFINDIRKIITKIPAKRQTIFFSATVPPDIQKLADTLLNNPVSVQVAPVSEPATAVKQLMYYVDKGDKKQLLLDVLKQGHINHALIFTRTKHGADKVVKDLVKSGISAEAIHGNKSQNARQRALNGFKDRTIQMLVATDIASRGIDVDKLTHVINYELPEVPETYIHRIGRTGRAGESGSAISFCSPEEIDYLKDINKLLKRSVEMAPTHPLPANVMAMKSPPKKKGFSNRRGPREFKKR